MDRTCRTCAYMVEKTEKGFWGGTSVEMYCMRIGVDGQSCATARHNGSPYAERGACGPTGMLWESKKSPAKKK